MEGTPEQIKLLKLINQITAKGLNSFDVETKAVDVIMALFNIILHNVQNMNNTTKAFEDVKSLFGSMCDQIIRNLPVEAPNDNLEGSDSSST